jgi:eukaryotic-like serine/threonine-protein kinase
MLQHAKLVVRRGDSPMSSQTDTGTGSGRLPEELVSDQVRRLALFAAIGAGLWSFGLLIELVLLPLTLDKAVPSRIGVGIESVGVLVSLAMFAYVRWSTHPPEVKRSVGLIYFVVSAFGVALLNTWAELPIMGRNQYLSWITIVILVFAMIAPAPPRQLLGASLIAASMDPLGIWLAYLRGAQVPSAGFTAVLYLPNYICAVVAVLPSLMLHHLGKRLRQAQELGSYRLTERLGQGGMGEVWRAEHRLLARRAAVKVVRPDVLGMSNDEEAKRILRRFEREARATSSLQSPHTIQVFDFGITNDGNFYYVMELLTGRDLESLVREFGPLSPDRTIYLMRQVCHSLADAHARGLVHRDIKPANIYVCRMGLEYDFVKVLDFGLAKLPNRAQRRQTMMTQDMTSGTPAYMAPEVILGDADVDRRADVYAVGCVAYFLLTGQLVFEADNPMKMLLQHVNATPVPPSQRSELPIPAELDAVVMSCLEKDPNKRPQNAEELFRMTCSCMMSSRWNPDAAQDWWSTHLPELTGPLSLEVVDVEVVDARESAAAIG